MAIITGERVTTGEGGFNPSFQRHRAEYRLSASLLGPGRVLDLGCGTGHSYDELAPRETVGVDIEAAAPTIEGVAEALGVAAARAGEAPARIAGAEVNWSRGWDESFPDTLIDRIIKVLGVAH